MTFKMIVKRVLVGMVAMLFIVALFLITFEMGGRFNPRIEYENVQVDLSDEMLADKIDNLKNDVVAKLRACESAGYTEKDAPIIFDTNHKASVGTLQWQVDSVKYYVKMLEGRVITNKEAVLLALDEKQASDLAKRVMFGTKNMAGKDWYNCAVRHNLDYEIALIKKLETK